MGFPPRLDGKYTPLPSDATERCPNCHRKFINFQVVTKGKLVKRRCPYCDYEFRVQKTKLTKKPNREKGL